MGKLRTVLPISDVIRDSAVQLVLTHQQAHTSRGGCPLLACFPQVAHSEGRVFKAMNNRVRLGILPLDLFSNGNRIIAFDCVEKLISLRII